MPKPRFTPVADYLVLPTLTPEQIADIAERTMSFDGLIKDHIRRHLSYRYVVTHDGAAAAQLEHTVRGGLAAGKPLLDPG